MGCLNWKKGGIWNLGIWGEIKRLNDQTIKRIGPDQTIKRIGPYQMIKRSTIQTWLADREREVEYKHSNERRDQRGEVPVCIKLVPNSNTVPSNRPLLARLYLVHLQIVNTQ